MTRDDDWFPVAAIIRPHSLRGAVQLKPFTRTVDEFMDAPLEKVFLRDGAHVIRPLHLETRSLHKGLPLVTFKEITDRTTAESLRGLHLVIPMEERWPAPEGWFPEDLEGLDVIDRESGEILGTVLRHEEGPAHDYLIFTHPAREGGEVMLPHVDAFVHRIDVEAGQVIVTLPEGLLEL